MSRLRLVACAFPALLAAAQPAAAQRVLGFGDDAATLPAGMVRVTAGSLWDRANERYDADGKLRPLGAAASPAAWNGRYDVRLAAANPLVQSLSGLSAFDASLGSLSIGRRDASADGLFRIELGLLPRVTVGASARVANHAIEPGVTLNPALVEGTVGFNPAWTNTVARDRNSVLVTQFDSAVAQTGRRITQCQAAPATNGCTAIVANVSGAQALVTNAAAFATAINALYGGRKNAVGLPFVPVGNGAAQRAIDQRIQGFRDQFAALGNTVLGAQGPAGGALFSPADFTTLLTDSLYGFGLRPVRTVHAYGLGDVSVHAKVLLFQNVGPDTAAIRGFAVRQSAGLSLRLIGGDAPAVDEFFAPSAGTGGGGFTAQSFTDLFYGNRYSATLVVSLDQPTAQDFAMRVPSANAPSIGGVPFPLVAASREIQLHRAPGSRLDVSITPRLALTRNIWLGASWSLSQQASDAWSSAGANSAVEAADVQSWASGTDWTEQRVAFGGTYSTVRAARNGRARRAFDVSYEHTQTLSGSGWRVPHLTRDVLTVRWYPRAWGR
ncbi:MAG: hypothetical protein P3B98_12220 [Gemmatimonadota bacterium]|nr:hypothetical protein [Gemmatimonadota bacterium]